MPKYDTIVPHPDTGLTSVYRTLILTDDQVADIPVHKKTGPNRVIPHVDVPRPSFDAKTHHSPVKQPDDIQATQVTQVWAAPVAKTAQEIATIKEREEEDTLDAFDRLSLRIDRNHENRLRTLEDNVQPQLSGAAFRALLKSLL